MKRRRRGSKGSTVAWKKRYGTCCLSSVSGNFLKTRDKGHATCHARHGHTARAYPQQMLTEGMLQNHGTWRARIHMTGGGARAWGNVEARPGLESRWRRAALAQELVSARGKHARTQAPAHTRVGYAFKPVCTTVQKCLHPLTRDFRTAGLGSALLPNT